VPQGRGNIEKLVYSHLGVIAPVKADRTQPDALESSTSDEEEIARYMQQRIDNGDLDIEDIPILMARYGLMYPCEFVGEMRERMAIMAIMDRERSCPR
jgi:hypothetical protein